ncbi:MAG: serine/threonine protein kinase, partial [Proteobacteria bacterium]
MNTEARTVGGRIELVHSIGQGGCATVWLGRHRDTGALVAVKQLAAGTEQAERFRREAEISAQLTHRNLVRVFDYFVETDGSAALVMEHLRGETLENAVERRGALPVSAAVACIVAVLRGLEHAHERGVIHRDLKPSNVFLAVEPDGYVVPKVLDFGVAKNVDERAILLTQHGHIVGTPAYMSPEQVRGEHVGAASDLFAVGAMLYELLTGELAFRAPSAQAAMMAILQREIERHPLVPEALWPVLERALKKDPAERHASATALREALEEGVGYTEQDGVAALQALEPVVAELPELPPRVPSSPSFAPPSLSPSATDVSGPVTAGLTV